MSEPRKPLFGFLWAKPDPNAPLDGAYRQERPVRIASRGPTRLLVLIVGTMVTVMVAGTVVMASLFTPLRPITLVGAAVAGMLVVLVLRGWVVGTFVSDEGVRIETTWRRTDLPWTLVESVVTTRTQSPLLGTPLRTSADRAFLVTLGGEQVPTHVYASSPDFWLRGDAFDIARLRLERWLPAR